MATLTSYYTVIEPAVADSTYTTKDLFTAVTADVNGDGKSDLIALGAFYPGTSTAYSSQPGRVLLGDGQGRFTPAANVAFSNPSLGTVHPRKVLFADFNGDGRSDMFVADHGYDASPFPGAQNRLYFGRADGGFDDASSRLPQLSDFTHAASTADIDGDGDKDIFVGNGYGKAGEPLSYMLINDGKGNFAMDRSVIPTAAGSILDFANGPHHFTGANFADLNGDGLPELMITADAGAPYDQLRQSVILWNKGGSFGEDAMTQLAQPKNLPSHIDLDILKMDINNDGKQDLVLIGTNGQPYYDGSFIQIFRNDGNQVFTDVTATAMDAADAMTSVAGTWTGKPWAMWVQSLDFNNDGVLDFAVEYNGGTLQQSTPLVWLNDGSGHFTTLKAGDFVAPGEEWRLGSGHFYKTDNGYSIVNTQYYNGSNGLIVSGMVASQAYLEHPATKAYSGGPGNDAVNGTDGTDTATYRGARINYAITKTANGFTILDKTGAEGNDTLSSIERIRFTDMTLNLQVGANAKSVAGADLKLLEELYVAFFNRVPDADGLDYWIGEFKKGASVSTIADTFYQAGVANSATTGYSQSMTNADFVRIVYKNVLGRSGATAPPDQDVNYWAGELANGHASKGNLVISMLGSAHTFKNDATWGWVADLLDNKAIVANYVAVVNGVNYNTAADSITNGMAISAAVTATDTQAAISLVGIQDSGFSLV
jgi:hypothetical protein